MTTTQTLTIGCAGCHREFDAVVQTLIDGQVMAQKAAFLQEALNLLECPHCHENLQPQTTLYYYDLPKKLALALIPDEINLPAAEQQSTITELATRLVNSLDKKARKRYLFTPQIFGTHAAISDAIFAADGITPEMRAAQTRRAQLIEEFLQITDPRTFIEKSKTHQTELDQQFFEILTAQVQGAQMQGDEARAKLFLQLRTRLGRANAAYQPLIAQIDAQLGLLFVLDQTDLLEKLQQAPSREERQALVAAGFDLLDNDFFKRLTVKLDKAGAGNTTELAVLKQLRTDVLELKELHAKASQTALEKAETFFKEVIQSATPDRLLKQKLDQVNETFFFVLGTNIAKARQRGQEGSAQALEVIGQAATALLQARQTALPVSQ
jgi:CpXC protein